MEYQYDALGRRSAKFVDDDGDASVDRAQHFVYDAGTKTDSNGLGPLDDLLLVLDGTAAVTTRHLHGPAVPL